jgi:hypothetical protein
MVSVKTTQPNGTVIYRQCDNCGTTLATAITTSVANDLLKPYPSGRATPTRSQVR